MYTVFQDYIPVSHYFCILKTLKWLVITYLLDKYWHHLKCNSMYQYDYGVQCHFNNIIAILWQSDIFW